MYTIVNTDNFGGDYPNESFVKPNGCSTHDVAEALVLETSEEADRIAKVLNRDWEMAPRYYKVEPKGYKLQPGFEP